MYPVGNQDQAPTGVLPNLNGYEITTGFFSALDPTHAGVDLANGSAGGEVRAIGAGLVVDRRATDTGFGWSLRIQHTLNTGEVVYSIYGHMLTNSLTVNVGDTVTTGQHIGQVDSTGFSTGSHLHFAIRNVNDFGCGYVPSTLAACTNDLRTNYRDPFRFIATIFSNFGPGYTIQSNGWFIGAGNFLGNAGSTFAMPFTPTTNAFVDNIRIAAAWGGSSYAGSGPNAFNVSLNVDSSGIPGPPLESFLSVALPALPYSTPPLPVFHSTLHPFLSAGTRYWVVVAAADPLNTIGAWLRPPGAPKGLIAYRLGTGPYASYVDEVSAFELTGHQ